MGILPHSKMVYYPTLVNFDCFHCNVIINGWNLTSSAFCESSWASYYDIISSPSYSQQIMHGFAKRKKWRKTPKKLFPRRVTTSLKLPSPPPPQKKVMPTFLSANGYLDFCSNQTIIEIKGMGIWPAMGCGRFASLYPKSLYSII